MRVSAKLVWVFIVSMGSAVKSEAALLTLEFVSIVFMKSNKNQ